LVVDFGDGGPGCFVVDDGGAIGVRGDKGLHGEVVAGAGQASGGFVDAGDNVVGEEGVGSPV